MAHTPGKILVLLMNSVPMNFFMEGISGIPKRRAKIGSHGGSF
jgi:hypothetical protein